MRTVFRGAKRQNDHESQQTPPFKTLGNETDGADITAQTRIIADLLCGFLNDPGGLAIATRNGLSHEQMVESAARAFRQDVAERNADALKARPEGALMVDVLIQAARHLIEPPSAENSHKFTVRPSEGVIVAEIR